MSSTNPDVILVHGSWMGAWCWSPVRSALGDRGIASIAIDLKGLGTRQHELSPAIGLADHVDDVLRCIDMNAAATMMLVGHSYGAIVAAEAAAARPKRVRAVLFIDGPIAEQGRTLRDLAGPLDPLFDSLVDPDRPGLMRPPTLDALGLSEANLPTGAILSAMPLRTHEEPARHSAADLSCRCAYIGFRDFPLALGLTQRAENLGWPTQLLEGGHTAFVDDPEPVAAKIAAMAS